MSNKRRKTLGKFLSLILRHDPQSFGVVLREDGFAYLDDLLRAVRSSPKFRNITAKDIIEAVKYDDKGRFEIRHENGKIFIRALYGHSKNLNVSIDYDTVKPEEVKYLYHGTIEDNVESILREGIKSQSRKYVHLSATIHDALQVAKRRKGIPVILVVDAKKMLEDGIKIYRATKKVFLVDFVPPRYIVKVLRKI